MAAKVPLAWKKNFRDNEAKRDEWLAKIEQVSGIRFTTEFSPSFDEYIQMVHNHDKQRDRAGETVYDTYLSYLHRSLERDLKDDMVKDAFVEAMSEKKKIVFELFDGKKISWSMDRVFTLTNGCIYLRAEPQLQDIGTYVYETKLENLL